MISKSNVTEQQQERIESAPIGKDRSHMKLDLDPMADLQTPTIPLESGPRSPYEEQPVNWRPSARPKKKHPRGSTARHTLGVDVAWLKKLIPMKNAEKTDSYETKNDSRHSLLNSERSSERRATSSLRQRLRGILGSSRNLKTPVEQTRAAPEHCRHPSAVATTSSHHDLSHALT
uniref:Uncharacterized protein n=1 Tax=Steinernema glaseri TaxID=37863 RepID=A0A1I8A690_9BILA